MWILSLIYSDYCSCLRVFVSTSIFHFSKHLLLDKVDKVNFQQSYLESFGSVDGSQRSEHSEDSEDLYNWNCTGAADTQSINMCSTLQLKPIIQYTVPSVMVWLLMQTNDANFDTNWRKKETSETLTTSRSSKLNQFLQNEPWWRNAPWTVIWQKDRWHQHEIYI